VTSSVKCVKACSNGGRLRVERAYIRDYVARSAQTIGFVNNLDDGDRSFRGNAAHLSPDEFVEHQIADHEEAHRSRSPRGARLFIVD